MWMTTLKTFVKAIEEQFGECPIDNIQADYDGITFSAGRHTYKYDYNSEKIVKY